MTWMGNDNECDYKLKSRDNLKELPTIVFKSFSCKNWDYSKVFTP